MVAQALAAHPLLRAWVGAVAVGQVNGFLAFHERANEHLDINIFK